MATTEPLFVDKAVLDKGERLGKLIMHAVGQYQANSPRTLQADRGTLGFSDLGACREYVRSVVTHAEKTPFKGPLKWEAFIGSTVGDGMEKAVKALLAEKVSTQGRLKLDLGDGIVIEGSSDIIFLPDEDVSMALGLSMSDSDAIVDLKAKDGLALMRRDGPSLQHWIQISGYLVAAIQQGKLTENATAHLVYYDRSGKDKTTYVASITFELALYYLEIARRRLHDVEVAIDTGEVSPAYLKDEPPSYCMAIGCPFYVSCWGETMPTGEITDPALIRAVSTVAEVRAGKKEATRLEDEAKAKLRSVDNAGETHLVEGFTPTHHVQWTLRQGQNGIVETLYVKDRESMPPLPAKE